MNLETTLIRLGESKDNPFSVNAIVAAAYAKLNEPPPGLSASEQAVWRNQTADIQTWLKGQIELEVSQE